MIHYIKGDATAPQGDGSKIIAHICNDKGGWGRGFVLALSRRWVGPEDSYRAWFKLKEAPDAGRFELGNVQLVEVEPKLWVANMIAQAGYGPRNASPHQGHELNALPPIRYHALENCLAKVSLSADVWNASIHMPRIGTGLGGGSWGQVEPIIARCFKTAPVFVYDL